MNKEDLFNYIRKEEVVIWAGAGFSKYAGYPLGGELKDLIFNALPLQIKPMPIRYYRSMIWRRSLFG